MSRVLIDPNGYVLLRGGKLAMGQEADPCCCTPEPPPGNCAPFWHFTCRQVPTRLVCCSWGDAFTFRLRASSWLRATLTRAGRELVQPDGSVIEFYPPPAGGASDVEASREVDLTFTVRREAGGGSNYDVLAVEGSYRHRWVRWRYTGDILSGAGAYDVLMDTTDPFALRGGLLGLARAGSGMDADFGWIADFGGLWSNGAASGIFPRIPEAPCSGLVDRVYLPNCDRYGGQFGRPWTEGGYDGQGGCDSPDRTLRLEWAGDTSCARSALAARFGYTIGGSRQVGDSGPATWTSVGRFEGELTASLEVVTSVPCVVPSCVTPPPPGPTPPPPPPPPDPGEGGGGGGTGGGGGGGGGTSPPPPPPPPQPTGCCLQPGPAGPRSVPVGGLTSAECLRAGGLWMGPGTSCPGGGGNGGGGAGAFAGGQRGAGQGCRDCPTEALGTEELVRRIRRGGV